MSDPYADSADDGETTLVEELRAVTQLTRTVPLNVREVCQHAADRMETLESSTGRCATCKHWQNPWDDPGSGTSKIPDDDRPRWGVCALIDMPDYSEKTTTIAFTQDGSDYAADLHTRDDFGCVLHEPHTTEETP